MVIHELLLVCEEHQEVRDDDGAIVTTFAFCMRNFLEELVKKANEELQYQQTAYRNLLKKFSERPGKEKFQETALQLSMIANDMHDW